MAKNKGGRPKVAIPMDVVDAACQLNATSRVINFNAGVVKFFRNVAADYSEIEEFLDRKLTDTERAWIAREQLPEKEFVEIRARRFKSSFPDAAGLIERVVRNIAYGRRNRKHTTVAEARVANALKSSVLDSLRQQAAKTGSRQKSLFEFLMGFSIVEIMAHLEAQFTGDMTWDNYGTHWQIDHIEPKSWFAFSSPADPQFKRCWGIENLKPLSATENRRKGARYSG